MYKMYVSGSPRMPTWACLAVVEAEAEAEALEEMVLVEEPVVVVMVEEAGFCLVP